MPEVKNRHHIKGNTIPKDGVYIGRGTIYGNPFSITKFETREDVVAKYRIYIEDKLNGPLGEVFRAQLIQDLYGKDLYCYCAPKACHGDILLEIANK